MKQLTATELHLTDGTVIPYGLCIWSTGVGPTPFTLSLPFAKTAVGRLAVDTHMRVLAQPPPQAPQQPQPQQMQPQQPSSSNGNGAGSSKVGARCSMAMIMAASLSLGPGLGRTAML